MARSTAVWTVLINGLPISAFTVKHELGHWLRKQNSANLEHYRIYRVPDGYVGGFVEGIPVEVATQFQQRDCYVCLSQGYGNGTN